MHLLVRALARASLVASLAGCGGARSSVEPSPSGAAVDDRDVNAPGDGAPRLSFRLVAEGWTRSERPETGLPASVVSDGPGYRSATDIRPPWSFVWSVEPGSRPIAGLTISPSADAPDAGPADIALFYRRGDTPIDRAGWPDFIETATRAGIARIPPGVPVVLVLDSPIQAHHVWMRVATNHGAPFLSFRDVRLLGPDDLRVLRAAEPDRVVVALRGVDTTPWRGKNVMGFPDLDGPDPNVTNRDGSGEGSGQSPPGSGEDPDWTTGDGTGLPGAPR